MSTFTVERPRKEVWSQPSPDLTPAIMELLAAGLTDEEIASEVERRGLRPVGRWRWGAWSVRLIRWRQHLHRPPRPPSPPKRPDGLLSLRGVTIQMGVSLRVVRYWIEKGLLKPAEGGGVGRTRWFNLDAPTLRCLEDASAKMSSRTVRQSSFAQGRAL